MKSAVTQFLVTGANKAETHVRSNRDLYFHDNEHSTMVHQSSGS